MFRLIETSEHDGGLKEKFLLPTISATRSVVAKERATARKAATSRSNKTCFLIAFMASVSQQRFVMYQNQRQRRFNTGENDDAWTCKRVKNANNKKKPRHVASSEVDSDCTQ
ncbi:hypothetical protein CCR75_002291 [Bremia lactucae]|uniref:Uncharacterized protein n=1 Tax=Bremia lactucae TaxID=4779 RepID=A0A976IF50_BRELC|nr:hypothetical protein CCR75_002291 [Bremia lactucae]